MYGLLSCISLPVTHASALETITKTPRVLLWRAYGLRSVPKDTLRTGVFVYGVIYLTARL